LGDTARSFERLGELIAVSRGLIKQAIEERDWDLLDKLLETDNSHVNDAKLFTDDWGEWWAPLYECCLNNQVEGVRVLLKHGAKRKQRAWGDGMCSSPLEVAETRGYQEIVKLLRSKSRPCYVRKSDPPIPPLTVDDSALRDQSEMAEKTGLVFPLENFRKD
jgi:hypothetical protein